MITLTNSLNQNYTQLLKENEKDNSLEKKWWKNYKASWKQDPVEEVDRLMLCLSDSVKKQLSEMFAYSRTLVQEVMLGHALEIKEYYSKTHYTFIHGQRLGFWVINRFTKEMAKLRSPSRNLSLYHFMREENKNGKIDVQYCMKYPHLDDHLPGWRKALISADAFFFNTTSAESVDYFVRQNMNVMRNAEDIEGLVNTLIEKYRGYASKDISNTIISLFDAYDNEGSVGNIYAICLPKNSIDKTAYLAHPQGEPCLCSSQEYRTELLNKYQNDVFEKNKDCQDAHLFPVGQYRICADMLNPEVNRIFCLTPVNKLIRKQYKEKIRSIAEFVLGKAGKPLFLSKL